LGCAISSEKLSPNTGNEAARARAVRRYRVLDMPPDRVFDRIATLAARICATPMAKVSIVDHDRIWLMAVHGLNPAIRQLDREDGLCAAVIEDQIPQVAGDALADPRTAGKSFVRDNNIRFYACAPITTSDGYRLGTVSVMDSDVREATEDQLDALRDLAEIVMEQLEWRLRSIGAIQDERRLRDAAEGARDDAQLDLDDARSERDEAQLDRDGAVRDRDIAERERDLIQQYATALQQTLLPPSLPDVRGMELASHYYPASPSQIGGDFYDVFALGDNRWAFFIGDVEGHGVGAAVATSLIRYTLRAAALHYSDPTEALAELNSVLLREMEPRRFCTVLYGTFRPAPDGDGFEVNMATGGHLPALLLDPSTGSVDQVRSRSGMLVGALRRAEFYACTVQVRPGQTLLMYTDGIVEARRGATPFDEETLAAFSVERAGLGAAGLVGELATLIPKLDPEDDVAVLAFGVE
jgi:phosphoserine phosphatase RsbU/P